MCENGARKTHVMYRCNLNSKQINQYLLFLLDSGMLEIIQERPNSKRYIYRTTGSWRRSSQRLPRPLSHSKVNDASIR